MFIAFQGMKIKIYGNQPVITGIVNELFQYYTEKRDQSYAPSL